MCFSLYSSITEVFRQLLAFNLQLCGERGAGCQDLRGQVAGAQPTAISPSPGRTPRTQPVSPLAALGMAKHHQALLLLVATVVALVCTRVQAWGSVKVVRKFQDISSSYVYVQQALWFAMQEYNKASNDMYFFKVMEILKTQEQVRGGFALTLSLSSLSRPKPWAEARKGPIVHRLAIETKGEQKFRAAVNQTIATVFKLKTKVFFVFCHLQYAGAEFKD